MSNETAIAVKTIGMTEVKSLLDNKTPAEVGNVLTDEWFKGENIAGTRRVPLDQIGNEVRTKGIAKDARIVTYCGGPKCPQSAMAAEKLGKLGFTNVQAFEGGLEEWKAAGFAIDKV